LLKNPQYTRPRDYEGHTVPEVLLSGDHAAIAEWRLVTSVRQTLEKRPELLGRAIFTKEELQILNKNSLLEAVEKYRNIQQ
jgi:tRNA (guanine37-N1)-methyltransferase